MNTLQLIFQMIHLEPFKKESLVYGFGIAGLIIIIIVGLTVFTNIKKKTK